MPISKQKRSQRQERDIAERVGGRVTPGSGSGWVTKNDVKNSRFSIEAKTTDKKSYSLKLDDLLKAERQAWQDSGRESAFVVQMAGGRQWLIVSLENGQELLRGTPDQA